MLTAVILCTTVWEQGHLSEHAAHKVGPYLSLQYKGLGMYEATL